jgi:hypothetical protein
MDTNLYNLTLDEEQLRVLMEALDMYSRLGMGQIDIVLTSTNNPLIKRIWENKSGDEVKDLSKQIKKLIFPELSDNAYYGIFNNKTPESSKISWDILQVVRYRLAWDKHPDGGYTVDFGDPLQSSTYKKLPTIKKVDK